MPVRSNIQITGVKEFGRAKEKMVKEDTIRIADGLVECGNEIFMMSDQLVPKDTLALEQSARIVVSGKGMFADVTVEYGGPDAPYAWIDHEDLIAHHEPPTQAKYLSHAVELTKAKCQQILRRRFVSTTMPVKPGGEVQ